MAEVFLKILNMSISATWLVLAVLLLRVCLKKAPRWIHVLLWGIVAVRLICPVTLESALSLIPSAETISPDIMMDPTPQITTGIPAINAAVNPIFSQSLAPAPLASANPLQIWIPVIAAVWLAGVAVMTVYTALSYFRLRRKVSTATRLYGNIFRSAHIPSPFVLGLIRPRIYLPWGMEEGDMAHVIAHEQTHIRRFDHWWKPLGFGLLTIHWFNPLMWLAYVLLCRDIELACDEKVIGKLGRDQRADYSQALLTCSVDRKMIAACPLAFGEVGVKERVKNVLSYKKPAFWIVILAVILCGVVAVCFLTDPEASREFAMDGKNVADLDPWEILDTIAQMEDLKDGSELDVNTRNFGIHLTGDFEWDDSQTIRFFYGKDQQEFDAQLRIFPEEGKFLVTEAEAIPEETEIFKLHSYLYALKYLPQDVIREMCPGADGYILTQRAGGSPDDYDRVITYTMDGTQAIDGWLIHLELQPMHDADRGQTGMGEEVIHLFYRDSAAEVDYGMIKWFDFGIPEVFENPVNLERTVPAYDGVTFRCNGYEFTAEDEMGETVLFTGMPIWNAFFKDMTGDTMPEICATVSFGSGLVDTHVVVYDFADGQTYTLWDRGGFDYILRTEDGKLLCEQRAFQNGGPYEGELVASGPLILADAGGGEGKRLVIDSADVKEYVISIVDRAQTEQLPTDEAIEVFYKDEQYTYSFASIRSHLVMVTYYDGTSEDIKSALETGRVTISDLDRYGIHYYAEPNVMPMDPVRTNLRGLINGYLFIPINGATYRYLITAPNPGNVTAEAVLDTFEDETDIEGIAWAVYSLKEYPDKTKLLMVSGTNSRILCEYAPAVDAEEEAREAARDAGFPITEDGRITGNRDAWLDFCEAAQRGRPGFIDLVHYITPDSQNQESAALYVHELAYDGDTFVLRTEDDVKVYEHLMKYTVSGTSTVTSAEHRSMDYYVLTHDNTLTWDEIWNSVTSSASSDSLDFHILCTDEN